MSDDKDRRSKMPNSSVNQPAKKGGAGGQFTWGRAGDVTDFEPTTEPGPKVRVASPDEVAEKSATGASPSAPLEVPANDSKHFPSLGGARPVQVEQAGRTDTEDITNALCIAQGLFMTAVTMVVPTRAPMVLAIKNGDSAGTARIMGLMSSSAACVELFVNPVFSRLSDKYGRKPFLLLAPSVNTMLHLLVAAFPKVLPVTFVDRMISGSFIFCFVAPINAALSDLFGTGPQYAMKMARVGTFFGLGCAVGPFIGAKLGGARSFRWSAFTFIATFMWLLSKVPETLKEDKRKPFDIAACSPLRFLKLFRQKTTAVLALTTGLQSFGDYVNIYDINFLYTKAVLGYGQAEIGNFATAVGLSQIANGEVMRHLIKSTGQKTATLVANLSWAVTMGLLGTTRGTTQLVAVVLTMILGHQRATGVNAYLQRHGQAAGMGAAEISGAQANFHAVLKIMVPVLYGNLFAWATSRGRNMPGMPYFLVAAFTLLGQLVFSSVDPDK